MRLVAVLVMMVASCDRAPPASTASTAATPTATATATAGPSSTSSAIPAAPFAPQRVYGEGKAMGTHLAFTAFTAPAIDEARVRKAFDAAIAEIERIEALMTTWRPDSELSRVNAAAGKSPVAVG